MSDEDDWDFAGDEDAKMTIRGSPISNQGYYQRRPRWYRAGHHFDRAPKQMPSAV